MSLPVSTQLKYWGIAALAVVVVLYVLGTVLTPFVLGIAIAYLLDPLADRLQRLGLSRLAAAILISLAGLVLFTVLVLLVVPTLLNQALGLAQTAPDLMTRFQDFVTERFPEVLDADSTVRKSLESLAAMVQDRGGALMQGAIDSFGSVVNAVVLIVLVPVISFYVLLDWDRLIRGADSLLPREHAAVVRRLARESDRAVAGFIRGQGLVCLILGTYYALALGAMGLSFGFLIGALAGALTFIPYIGALVGGTLALGMALYQFWGDWWWIAGIYAVFQLGQLVEGNILTPKLVGGSVGLHPVWLLFALTAFGSLFGFVGLLVAVPLAAVVGVVLRFLIEKYRASLLYDGGPLGPDGEAGEGGPAPPPASPPEAVAPEAAARDAAAPATPSPDTAARDTAALEAAAPGRVASEAVAPGVAAPRDPAPPRGAGADGGVSTSGAPARGAPAAAVQVVSGASGDSAPAGVAQAGVAPAGVAQAGATPARGAAAGSAPAAAGARAASGGGEPG